MTLDPVQIRVLGTLIEKEIVTPEYYPLSLNALLAGCNQKSSREPVMDLGESDVHKALHELEEQQLTAVVREGRVPRFEHRARTVWNLRRDETAVICLLLLRGPQTPGELRSRAERMYSFDDIAAVQTTLERLMLSPDDNQSRALRPLVAALPRQPGSREVRFAHLFGGQAAGIAERPVERHTNLPRGVLQDDQDPDSKARLAERVRELEGHLESLRTMIGRIEQRLASQSHADGAEDDSRS